MPTEPMRRILQPTPNSRTVFARSDDQPFKRGQGDMTYTCAKCGIIILENVSADEMRELVFQCHACGTYNEV